jgi:hypothetical protein
VNTLFAKLSAALLSIVTLMGAAFYVVDQDGFERLPEPFCGITDSTRSNMKDKGHETITRASLFCAG